MEVKISTKESTYTYNIPINEIALYLDLLRTYTLIDEDGDCFKISHILIDIFQNVIDISTEEE